MALVEGKWSGGRRFMKKKKSSQGLLPDDWRRMDVDSGLTSGEVSGESTVALQDWTTSSRYAPVQDQSRLNFPKGCLCGTCKHATGMQRHAKALVGVHGGRSLMQGD